jgi:hypothetical protein
LRELYDVESRRRAVRTPSLGCRYRVASFAYVFAEGYYNYYSVHLSASDSSNGTGGSATIQEGGGRAGFGFTF